MDIDIPPYKGRETATERDYHPWLYKNTYSFPWSKKPPDSWVSSVEFWRSLNSEIIWIFFPLQRSFLSYELTVFQKYKGSAGNSDCGSPTGAFSMDDYKKANNTTETLLLPKSHIRMMNWQNMKETNPVTSTAIGEFQAIPGRRKSVVSVLHSEFIFATSVFHITERLKLCLVPL